ncbi:MAG: hypothetical protein Q8R00_04650 [Candidatus Nanoarchaeia archaeon]|nr:hypothetical protein [Candidatus Nanoarchaeia archaeon]
MVNLAYLKQRVIKEIKKDFINHPIIPNIQLTNFLNHEEFNKLKKQITKLKYKLNYQPDMHSYYSAKTPKQFDSLIKSKGFKIFIEQCTGEKIKNITTEAQLFKAGNYTLLQDKQNKKNITIYFDFNKLKQGYTVFFNKNYNNLNQYSIPNALSIVKQAPNFKSFIKYINHQEKGKRYLIKGIFTIK